MLIDRKGRLGRRKIKEPCAGCGLNPTLCLCGSIPRLDLKTRVLLVIHARELEKTTNTGRLALKALSNGELRVRGESRERLDLTSSLSVAYEPLLFYPSPDARELDRDFVASFHKPILLIVPDGNWRQASKVHTRHPELANIPRAMISEPNLAARHLRTESSSYGMSTLEAIGKALAIIEGDEVGRALAQLYREKLERTLRSRVGGLKPDLPT